MKIRIIAERCQGHAMCHITCPDLFALRESDGHAYVLHEVVPPDFESEAKIAELGCPENAIELSA